jgi:hypothetical protein
VRELGLRGYPFAIVNAEEQAVEPREFPKSSGYVEDPARGIAAAALVFELLDQGLFLRGRKSRFCVRQCWAMGGRRRFGCFCGEMIKVLIVIGFRGMCSGFGIDLRFIDCLGLRRSFARVILVFGSYLGRFLAYEKL